MKLTNFNVDYHVHYYSWSYKVQPNLTHILYGIGEKLYESSYEYHLFICPNEFKWQHRTSSLEDFRPISRTFLNIPRPVFIDVNAPLDVDPYRVPPNPMSNNYNLRSGKGQSFNSFAKPTINAYKPRNLYSELSKRVINPMSIQGGQPGTVKLPLSKMSVEDVTISLENGSKTVPPPAHSQKPDISIIPETTISKPSPFVPVTSKMALNPVGLSQEASASSRKTTANQNPSKKFKVHSGSGIQNVTKSAGSVTATQNRDSIQNAKATVEQKSNSDGKSLEKICASEKRLDSVIEYNSIIPKVSIVNLPKQITVTQKSSGGPVPKMPVGIQNVISASHKERDPKVRALLQAQIEKAYKDIRNQIGQSVTHNQKFKFGKGLQVERRSIPGSQQKHTIVKPADSSSQNFIGLRKTRKPSKPSLQPKILTLNPVSLPKKPIAPPPPAHTASSTMTTPTIDLSTSPEKTAHQSPSQKNMRTFMEHLHELQQRYKKGSLTGSRGGTKNGVSTVTSASSSTTTTTQNPKTKVLNYPISSPPALVKLGATQARPTLKAARNLSNLPNTLQGTNVMSVAGTSTSTVDTPRPPILRVIGPVPNQVGAANAVAPFSSNVMTSRMQVNGFPVTKIVTSNRGSKPVKRLVTSRGLLPLSSKGVIVSPKIGSSQVRIPTQLQKSPIRILPPHAINTSPLTKKMIANYHKILPSAPSSTFKNGSEIKTYSLHKKNNDNGSQSPSNSPVAASNKENRTKKRLTLKGINDAIVAGTIDLSREEDKSPSLGAPLSQEVVNTLKKKGVSVNYVGKEKDNDIIKLD